MEGRRRSFLADPEAEKLQSIKNRRKSSVNQAALDRALAVKVAMVEGKELSEADRKLAEMGYQQVRHVLLTDVNGPHLGLCLIWDA